MNSINKKIMGINLDDYDYESIKKITVNPNELSELIDNYKKKELEGDQVERRVYLLLSYYILKSGLQAFNDKKHFYKACRICIEICLKYNDFYNSNNIMMAYKTKMQDPLKRGLWYYRLSLDLYSKRFNDYYFLKPDRLKNKIDKFYEVIERRNNRSLNNEKKQFEATVNQILFRYMQEYDDRIQNFNTENARQFINYFLDTPLLKNERFNDGIKQFEQLIEDKITFDEMVWNPTGNIFTCDDIDDEVEEYPETIKKENSIEDNIETGFNIADENIPSNYRSLEKGKIVVLGAPIIAKDTIKILARKSNLNNNIEFIDYDKLQCTDISQKFGWSNVYTAVIICAVPHSVKGKGDNNSIINFFEKGEGRPFSYIMRTENGELKASKAKFRKAFEAIRNEFDKFK